MLTAGTAGLTLDRDAASGARGGAVALVAPAAGWAQAPATAPQNPDKITVGGSWRLRPEVWDWFDPGIARVDHRYHYIGSLLRLSLSNATRWRDWTVEFAQPSLINLPNHAVAPGAAGQLGLGGTYKVVNGNQEATLFIKQAFIHVRQGIGA